MRLQWFSYQPERFLDMGANDIIQVSTTIIVIGGTFLIFVPHFAGMVLLPMSLIVWGAVAFENLVSIWLQWRSLLDGQRS
jgi:ATP-binding cassette, subfamily B, bacterial